MTANKKPFTTPVRISFQAIRNALPALSSRVAKERTTVAKVWVPAFPPIDAQIGISTAKADNCSIAFSKMPITDDAKKAVPRLIKSHEKRDCAVDMTER